MSDRRPQDFDPWRLVENSGSVSLQAGVSELPRIAGLLHDRQGTASLELEGTREQGGRGVLRGKVRAAVNLTCQRCMAPFTLTIDRPVRLGLVENAGQAADLPVEYDPLQVPYGRTMALAELLSDELILALPAIPRHEDESVCGAGDTRLQAHEAGDAGLQQPFSGLRDLLSRARETEQE